MSKKKDRSDMAKDRIRLAGRMKHIRQELGMTQAQVAELLQVTPGFICNIENGRSAVSLKLLVLYAELLHTTVDAVLGMADPPYRDRSQENEVLALFSRLSERDREKMIELMHIWLA